MPRTRRVPAAFLSIKTQFDNIGDALINRELCRLVSDRADTWVDFSRAPVVFERAMSVANLPRVATFRSFGFVKLILEMVKQRLAGRPCYFFLNPGGLGGHQLSFKRRASASVYNTLLALLSVLGVRICLIGISVDPVYGFDLAIMKIRRNLLHAFAVRDSLTSRYVESVGMPADELVPDLSFNLYGSAPPDRPTASKAIAFSFRFDGKADEEAVRRHIGRILSAYGSDYEYLFVAQVNRDAPGIQRIHDDALRQGFRSRMIACTDDIGHLCAIYANCIAIYSNRLHALLAAAYSGAVPYALVAKGRQPKIEGLFRDLGLEHLLLFIDDEDAALTAATNFDRQRLIDEHYRLNAYFDTLLGAPLS